MKDKTLQIRLDAETADIFDAVCEKMGYNKSALMRRWIKDFIEHEKTFGRFFPEK